VFVWVMLMNALDFLPVDIVALGTHSISEHGFRIVPTADVNTTFALALTVWLLMIFFNIKVKGLGGWLHELTCAPFGAKPLWAAPFLIFFNVLFNFIEYVSKPLSHSLRLFGNMYAGEIIFLLLWLWAAKRRAWNGDRDRPRTGLGDFPHPDRGAAGVHFHDAHRRVHRARPRASLAGTNRYRTLRRKGNQKWTNCSIWQ
jgi:hypothetical protein